MVKNNNVEEKFDENDDYTEEVPQYRNLETNFLDNITVYSNNLSSNYKNGLVSDISIASSEVTLTDNRLLDVLAKALDINESELYKLDRKQLIILKEAINREYDLRREKAEQVNKVIIKDRLNRILRREQSNKSTEMSDVQKLVALEEVADLWKRIKEQRILLDKERDKLLDACDNLIEEILSEGIEDDIVLKKAILNISKTSKLSDVDINQNLYQELIDSYKQREEEEFYNAITYDEKEELKKKIVKLNEEVESGLKELEQNRALLEGKIDEVKNNENSQDILKDSKEVLSYTEFKEMYENLQREIHDLLYTYNKCERSGILTTKEDELDEQVGLAIVGRVNNISASINDIKVNIDKRILNVYDKGEDKSKDKPEIALTREVLGVVNLLGKSALLQERYTNAMRKMTTEERYLAKEIDARGEEHDIGDDITNSTWGKEVATTVKILWKLIRNKSDSKLKGQVAPYKIDNNLTVKATKEKISGAKRKEYSDAQYNDAIGIIKQNSIFRDELPVTVSESTIEDCYVLAQRINDEYTKRYEDYRKEWQSKLLAKLESGKKVSVSEIENVYKKINEFQVKINQVKSVMREAFSIVISKKEDLSENVQESKVLNVLGEEAYNNYVERYKKEYVTTKEDVDYVIDKVKNMSVDGGYYYIAVGDEQNKALDNVGEPVLLHKGIIVLKINEDMMHFNKDSGEFLVESSNRNLVNNELLYTELDKDKLYTVEQDRDIDRMKQLIEDEEKMLNNNNILGIYRDNGTPVLSSGLERKITYAETALSMLEYIHTREGNTEYEEEEELIKGLSSRINDLRDAFENQHFTMKRLKTVIGAYSEVRKVSGIADDQQVNSKMIEILDQEYNELKSSFMKNSEYIKCKANDLFAYQYNVDMTKFRIDVRKTEKEVVVSPKDFWGKVKKFFNDLTQKIKDVFSIFTKDGLQKKVNDIVTGLLGVDNSRGNVRGVTQWLTEFWTMDNEQFKDDYMSLAKQRDEENRKKNIDGKEKNSVLLNSELQLEKSEVDVSKSQGNEYENAIGEDLGELSDSEYEDAKGLVRDSKIRYESNLNDSNSIKVERFTLRVKENNKKNIPKIRETNGMNK